MEQSAHRAAYMALQELRGRPVGRFIRDLQAREKLERNAFDRMIATELQEQLRFARAKVPLYSTGPWSQALAQGDPTQLSAWPILDRATVRARGSELLARGPRPGAFYRSSSASTGEPLRIAWNPHGAAWGWANEYRVMLWYGVAPGVRTLLMWGSEHRLQDWVRNTRGFLTTALTPQRLEEAAQYVLKRRPELVMGLPSALVLLARYIRTNYPNAPRELVRFAKLGGEQIYPFQREELEKHFGARAVEFYGCTEVGPIAAQCPEGSMHLLSDNSYIEICRDGEPVPDGEFGDIVATSLSNRAMPLVRCRIGDSGAISPDPCRCGRPYRVLTQLIGRAADLFIAADGTKVHGSQLGTGLQKLLTTTPLGIIRQVLFQQLDPLHWKVLVESGGGFDAGLAAQLTALVRSNFGQQCDVEIERVSVVPREPSGKFRYYRPPGLRPGGQPPIVIAPDYNRKHEDRLKMV
jgi:phenylacetate-coenzyme A ligase PaaK-like adenylate-forming protein